MNKAFTFLIKRGIKKLEKKGSKRTHEENVALDELYNIRRTGSLDLDNIDRLIGVLKAAKRG